MNVLTVKEVKLEDRYNIHKPGIMEGLGHNEVFVHENFKKEFCNVVSCFLSHSV